MANIALRTRNSISSQRDGTNSPIRGEDLVDAASTVLSDNAGLIDTIKKVFVQQFDAFKKDLLDQFKTYKEMHDREKEALYDRIEQLEQYTRRDNIVVANVPESTGEQGPSDEEQIMDIFTKDLGLDISVKDISVHHRLGKPVSRSSSSSANQSTRHRPIVVKFIRRIDKNAVYDARFKLKDANRRIYINEHLTTRNSALLFSCRQLKKRKLIAQSYSDQCKIFIRLNDSPGGTRGRKILIQREEDLIKLGLPVEA